MLEYLERKPSDFFALQKNFDFRSDKLANELNNLLNGGYVTKMNGIFSLTDRGREYLKVERGET